MHTKPRSLPSNRSITKQPGDYHRRNIFRSYRECFKARKEGARSNAIGETPHEPKILNTVDHINKLKEHREKKTITKSIKSDEIEEKEKRTAKYKPRRTKRDCTEESAPKRKQLASNLMSCLKWRRNSEVLVAHQSQGLIISAAKREKMGKRVYFRNFTCRQPLLRHPSSSLVEKYLV